MGGYSDVTEGDLSDGLAYAADPTGTAGTTEAYQESLEAGSGGGGYNPYTTPYGITWAADEWQGWEAEISEHSAGLEMYTPPSEPGQPGITELTDAGKIALGYSLDERVILTYSWGAPVDAAVKKPDPILDYLLQQIQPLINAAVAPLIAGMAHLKAALTNTINAVWSALSKSVSDLAKWTLDAYNYLKSYIENAIAGISAAYSRLVVIIGGWISAAVQKVENTLQPAIDLVGQKLREAEGALRSSLDSLWSWVISHIDNLLAEVKRLWDTVQEIVQRAEEEATKTAAAIAELNGSLQVWVQDHIIEILLLGLDGLVVSV